MIFPGIVSVFSVLLTALFIVLLIRFVRRFSKSKQTRCEKQEARKSLAETLKEQRVRCQMTQEFVAETLGVSRQAVSKWENGTSDPSTTNLISLAKLYGVSAEDLLKRIIKSID